MTFRGKNYPVQEVSTDALRGVDIVLASAGNDISAKWAPIAVQQGAVVIDNSNAFRMDKSVPLVVPEVNGDAIGREARASQRNSNVALAAMPVGTRPTAGLDETCRSTTRKNELT